MNDTEFLSARLDEWERLARAAYPVQTGSRDEGQPPEHVSWRRGPGSVEFGLRQIEADRKLLDLYERAKAYRDSVFSRPEPRSVSDEMRAVTQMMALEQAIRLRVAIYADYEPGPSE